MFLDVERAIKSEPDTYYQRAWCIIDRKTLKALAMCVAGHLVFQRDGRFPARRLDLDAVPLRARTILRVYDGEESDREDNARFNADLGELFSGNAFWSERGFTGYRKLQPGTPAYVKHGLQRLRRFRERWEERLKATKLAPRARKLKA